LRSRLAPAAEALLLLAITLPAALLTRQPGLWFLIPFVVITVRRRDYAEYGLELSSWRQWHGARFHLTVLAATFAPYTVGHYAVANWLYDQQFDLTLPPGLGWMMLDQLLGVALPEEFFFRGYLQSQLNRSLPGRYTLLGARCGAALPATAALFALCHVPAGGPGQLMVFFPGLLYGWLRERTDSVVVPTVYHAASNLLLKTMLLSLH
jgi:membrane protease YdiL (CAAX protease family)